MEILRLIELKKPVSIERLLELDKSLGFISTTFHVNVREYHDTDPDEVTHSILNESLVEKFIIYDDKTNYKARKLLDRYIINWTAEKWGDYSIDKDCIIKDLDKLKRFEQIK